jgi:HSP20 family protein
MSLVKYNSNNGLRSFDNFFDSFFNNNLTDIIGSDNNVSQPSVNVIETDDEYRIEVAAPGLGKEDFDVNIDDNSLTISAEVKNEETETTDKYTRREFNYSAFKRSFNLPDTVNAEQITAGYENGVLTLNLPKREEAKPQPARKIEIS